MLNVNVVIFFQDLIKEIIFMATEKEETVIQHLLPVPHKIITSGSTRSIHLYNWTVMSIKGSILTSREIRQFSSRLTIPIPDMTFGRNQVMVKHHSGWKMTFTAYDALEGVNKTGKEMIQVSYAQEWIKKRQKSCEGIERSKLYDWTFTTAYQGTVSHEDEASTSDAMTASVQETDNGTSIVDKTVDGVASNVIPIFVPFDDVIPLDKLKRQDPILFFDEVVLYEDELSDNGLSILSVKVRVMPERLLVLQRFFMRLDNVIFRVRDTRIYIEFDTEQVIKEYIEKEAPYQDVLQKVPLQQNDLGVFLTDSAWVASVLPTCTKTVEALKFR